MKNIIYALALLACGCVSEIQGQTHRRPTSTLYTINVLELYTPDAAIGNGGAAGIETKIRTAVALLNSAVQNAGVFGVTFNLVFVGPMSFSSSDAKTVLLSLPADPRVTSLRDTYAADLVGVWQTDGSIAFQTEPGAVYPSSGFHVIASDQDVNLYPLLSHEIGHNLGCHHDALADSFATSAHGYCSPTGFRDVMAMNCPTATIAQLFSNPNVTYNYAPAGVAGQADCAAMIAQTAPIVSAYR